MATCLLCQHAQLSAIEDALAAGSSVRSVASQFGLSKSAVHRHQNNCLSLALRAPSAPSSNEVATASTTRPGATLDIASRDGLLAINARALERLEAAGDIALAEGRLGQLAGLTGQLFRGVADSAKLQGLYPEPNATTTFGNPNFSIKIVVDPAYKAAPNMRNVTPDAGTTGGQIAEEIWGGEVIEAPSRDAGASGFSVQIEAPGFTDLEKRRSGRV